METNSKKILQALPDYNDIISLLEEIKQITLLKMKIENGIKEAEAKTFQIVMTDEKYFRGGKPVSTSYFENCYKFAGIDGGLLKFRQELISITSELDMLKARLDLYKQMHDMYKTMVFAERSLA